MKKFEVRVVFDEGGFVNNKVFIAKSEDENEAVLRVIQFIWNQECYKESDMLSIVASEIVDISDFY